MAVLESIEEERMVMIKDVQDVWVAWTNTDCTEGRGEQIPKAVCLMEATAIRLGKGGSVQGSDCRVTKGVAILLEGRNGWLIPGKLEHPNETDKKVQVKMDAKRDAIKKCKDLGMSDDEIQAMVGG
jgi:hypothetical protein